MNVIKLTKEPVKAGENTVFALDTNVLLWMFYGRLEAFRDYQTDIYPSFVAGIISNGNKIIITATNLNEMFHAIEKNEHKIYCETIGEIKLKQFRKIASEREKVKNTISLVYSQIKTIENVAIVESTSDDGVLNDFLEKYCIHNSDFYDFTLLEYSNTHNISIVTDDIDFYNDCVETDIYTANNNYFK